QQSHMFGMTVIPKQQSPANDPPWWAAREVDPTFKVNAYYPGQAVPAQGVALENMYFQIEYRVLLLLASGIQMAGPRLTPAAFAAGLHRAVFPNPPTPLFAGRAGFNGTSQA